MRILADENCGATLISALVAAGHDVKAVAPTRAGIGDEAVFALARDENRTLLTYDRDFGLIAERASDRPPAILLARLRNMSSKMRAKIILGTISDLGDSLIGRLTVIEPHQIRGRPYND